MPQLPNRNRQMPSSSRPLASQSLTGSGIANSRPFLNMLNPMNRTYQGYLQANQVLPEEDDENASSEDEQEDLEAGQSSRSNIFRSKSKGKQRVSWGAEASELNVLHPNIRQEDRIHDGDHSDDEVPQDFMIEATSPPSRKLPSSRSAKGKVPVHPRQPLNSSSQRPTPPILPTTANVSIPPRPSELEPDDFARSEPSEPRQPKPMRGLDAYERALWNWVNVYNLDAFLQEVYYYYEGKGIYSIALSRGLNLLTVGFVIGFSTFLLGCVDYSRIRPEGVTRLDDIIVEHCVSKFSGFTLLFFVLFTAFYAWQIVAFALGIFRLVDMYNFYTHLLRIPDADIQTISWPDVVRRIGAIREENPLTALASAPTPHITATLDAHDIANRIMRQENYLIALFNKEVLDLRVPMPASRFVPPEEGKGKTLTRALEWNLRFCLMEFLFDPQGRVRRVFLKSKNRAALIEGLRRRFIFMGILNAIFAPFIVPYLLMYSFFRYFEEYHKNPSSIGGRRYTPFAQWKFREFNELPHIFARRLDESYPTASMYIGQFPNEKMALIMRFIAFVAGSFAAVLLLASVIDPDLFLYFEVTPHRTVLFYLGVFTSILAVARGMIPDENNVFDPEMLMEEVIQYTHYMPDEWKEQLHSQKVHQEFGRLFAMKVMIFAQELISVVLTPLVLWFSLPRCAPAIIDFFRDFTVHVDGRGYVCSFAEFDFHRHGNIKFGAPTKIHDKRMMSKEGKMEKSFLNFKAANPDWNPTDPSGSLYLSRMADINVAHSSPSRRRRPGPGLESTMTGTVLLGERRTDLADRASEYDRALRQSQHAARKRHQGGSGSILIPAAPTGVSSSSMLQSGVGGMAMAQTAVLGDSAGSVRLQPRTAEEAIPSEDIAPDGGVGSGLGESYVDGGEARRSKPNPYQQVDEDEDLEDGGVLGLLAQIYGAKGQGPARVI
ncbi:hypothetical protein PLICRDRAFT_53644 [Plicaturopsis crispa FD-325 SS-3]|nr:hypothetical protein PLICRDRAFT_53644 [Plicaturopsis crispa FD-325 SS-3]